MYFPFELIFPCIHIWNVLVRLHYFSLNIFYCLLNVQLDWKQVIFQLSTSAPYNNVIHINMKMINVYINDKQKWCEKGGKGIECKCISSWVQSMISYHLNLLVWCIYFCTFLNTIELFSSVKLSEPFNKVSIEITVPCNIHK